MATHSSILAWRIPWTEEPGGLLSIGSHKSRTQLKRLSISSIKRVHRCSTPLPIGDLQIKATGRNHSEPTRTAGITYTTYTHGI